MFTLTDPIPPILIRVPFDCSVILSESDTISIGIGQCKCTVWGYALCGTGSGRSLAVK